MKCWSGLRVIVDSAPLSAAVFLGIAKFVVIIVIRLVLVRNPSSFLLFSFKIINLLLSKYFISRDLHALLQITLS